MKVEQLIKYLHQDPSSEETTYNIDLIKRDHTIIPVGNVGWIAFSIDDLVLNFYVFSFVSSQIDGSDAEGSVVWYGQGVIGNLRELRHSYFAKYVFYINLDLMNYAVTWLKAYFDD